MTFFRALVSVSGMTFASRLLGLVRDIAIAVVFGASALTDAFFTAFRLPNMMRRFSAEGAMTQAFVPVYAAATQEDEAVARRIAGEMMIALSLVLAIVVALGVLFAEAVINVLAPGLEEAQLAAQLFQIVFPYVLFVSLVALCAGILNTHHFYTAAAFAPLLLNIALITSALLWADMFEQKIFALAWGVFIGGCAQLLWMMIHLKRAKVFPSLRLPNFSSSGVGRVFRLMGIGMLGSGAAQLNLLINLFIASFLAAGSISWLYYADRLMELPVGVLGAALAVVALPALSQHASNAAQFQKILDVSLRLLVVFALPAAAGMAALALPLVSALFMHGEFSPQDAKQTQAAVLAYSVGIVGLAAVRLLAAAFFARQDFKIPVLCAVLALVVTQCLNAVFVWGMSLQHIGLALSIGIAACANALTLLIILLRRQWFAFSKTWLAYLLRVVLAVLVMTGILYALQQPNEYWLNNDGATQWQRIGYVLLTVGAGAAAYFITLHLSGIRLAAFYLSLKEKPKN